MRRWADTTAPAAHQTPPRSWQHSSGRPFEASPQGVSPEWSSRLVAGRGRIGRAIHAVRLPSMGHSHEHSLEPGTTRLAPHAGSATGSSARLLSCLLAKEHTQAVLQAAQHDPHPWPGGADRGPSGGGGGGADTSAARRCARLLECALFSGATWTEEAHSDLTLRLSRYFNVLNTATVAAARRRASRHAPVDSSSHQQGGVALAAGLFASSQSRQPGMHGSLPAPTTGVIAPARG